MIELIAIEKTYLGNTVLHNVNLKIGEGDIFGIIGKSGAGKSTLLRCINLLERPEKGQVLVAGQNLLLLKPKELAQMRHRIGMVFQHFNLLGSKTVFENIALPLRVQGKPIDEILARVDELLALVELKDKKDAYPASLSGGQKQRVAIARALASNPKILLCDEITSALDPETTAAIIALLKKINHFYGITIIFITHDMGVVKRLCHRLALIEKGRIQETMALSEVMQHSESEVRKMLYQELAPQLPECIKASITQDLNDRPIIRLFFQGDAATAPFISLASQELHLNINILLANIDRYDGVTCGVLILELAADRERFALFLKRCREQNLNVEVLGYVANSSV
ncbi:MAG: DL-methionine transporter ATP-binding subunit [Legionellales bacterium RIFCSPHIGHO2_12_FULL_37_14]|nr:MAG: DL-methionine transporter ATP-binding subunit [Legionellales bacterium RIFCSPHIGHO2_12_FULL_37_14]